jgi:hypothetical protein
MPTPETENLGAAAKRVSEKASAIARLELELASLELKKKGKALGVGAGLAIAAAAVGFYAIGFLFFTIAAGLAEAMPLWLALLIVTLVLFVATAILGLLGVRSLQRGKPVPEQAIDEAKLTKEALKGNGSTQQP